MIIQQKTFVVMGVSGCGKSSIGAQLAKILGGLFADADDFHPVANITKMTNHMPLTDDDRWLWLEILREQIMLQRSHTEHYVLACSALKQSYRQLLRGNDSPETLMFVYLKGSKELIMKRMQARIETGSHFMPMALLNSQFATLEEPTDNEAIVVDIELTPDEIINAILDKL